MENLFILLRLLLLSLALFFCKTVYSDVKGSADYPNVGRFPNAIIAQHTLTPFAIGVLPLSKNSYETPHKFEKLELSGKRTTIIYDIPNRQDASVLEVSKSLEMGLKKQGFEIHLSCFSESQFGDCGYFLHRYIVSENVAKTLFQSFNNFYNLNKATVGMVSASKDDLSVWVVVAKSNYSPNIQYAVDVFERNELNIREPILTSGKLAKDIYETGRAVLSGIYFDFNSAKLKDESDKSLRAISTYIKAHSNSSFFIVGHTDTYGSLEQNISLSESRAEAVKTALIESYDVSASLLQSIGVGFVAPSTTNLTEDGRAKNRRVEIVVKSTP
jgi:outer membrane protein OmpA-like peptidoglycan-associated protein